MVVGVVVPHPPTPGHLRQLRSRGSGRGLRVSAFPLGHDPPVAQQQPHQPHQQLLQPGFVPGERVRTIGPDLPVRPLLGRKEKPGTPLAPSMLQTTALPGKQPPAAAEMNARMATLERSVMEIGQQQRELMTLLVQNLKPPPLGGAPHPGGGAPHPVDETADEATSEAPAVR